MAVFFRRRRNQAKGTSVARNPLEPPFPMMVVDPAVIAEWAAETEASVIRLRPTPDGHGATRQTVDVPMTLVRRGLLPDPAAPDEPPTARLVIEDCRAVQVGDDNRQRIDMRIDVRDVKLFLDKNLLDHLADHPPSPGSWPQHCDDVHLSGGSLTDRSTREPARSFEGPSADGTTYVVVRRSTGVQIGDHNEQRSRFHYVMKGPELDLGETLGENGVRQLADLYQQGSVRQVGRELADMLEKAAFDVERGPVSVPQGDSAVVSGHDGVTAGDGNVQDVQIDVRVEPIDRSALTDVLRIAHELTSPVEDAFQPLADLEGEPVPPHDDVASEPPLRPPSPEDEPAVRGRGIFDPW